MTTTAFPIFQQLQQQQNGAAPPQAPTSSSASSPTLADVITQSEGARPEDHNPGNLSVAAAQKLGIPITGSRKSVGAGATNIAQFADDETGKKALAAHLARYSPDTTYEQLASQYAPGQPEWLKNVTTKMKAQPGDKIGTTSESTSAPAAAQPFDIFKQVASQQAQPKLGRTGPLYLGGRGTLGKIQDQLLDWVDKKVNDRLVTAVKGTQDKAMNDPVMKYFSGDEEDSPVANPEFVGRTMADLIGLVGSSVEHPVASITALVASKVPYLTVPVATYFGYQSGKMLTAPKSKDETAADYVQRLLLGSSGVVGAAAAVGDAGPKDFVNAKTAAARMPDVITAAKAMFNRGEISAASTQMIEDLRDKTMDTLNTAMKAARQKIGQIVDPIVRADTRSNPGGVFPVQSLGTELQRIETGLNAPSSMLPSLQYIKDVVSDYSKRFGGMLSWENIKDIRNEVGVKLGDATGKDLAAMGQLYEGLTNVMKARANQLKLSNNFTAYNMLTKQVNEIGSGVMRQLTSAPTGVDWYEKLTKPSLKPLLRGTTQNPGMLDVLEDHGGLQPGQLEDDIKQHAPLAQLAKASEKSVGGMQSRMAAFARHPAAAIPAALGAYGASAMIGLPMRWIWALMGSAKAADMADQFDAAMARQRILARAGVPQSVGAVPGGVGTPPGGVGTPPGATGGPQPSPLSLNAAPAAVKPAAAPTSQATRGGPSGPQPTPRGPIPLPASSLSVNAASAAAPTAMTAPQVALPSSASTLAPVEAPKVVEASPKTTPTKVAKTPTPKAYEEFGVTLDPTTWKTPEDVVNGKRQATQQLIEAAKSQAVQIDAATRSGSLKPEEAKEQLSQLASKVLKANKSIEKVKSPEIGRGARDRIRKGTQAEAGRKDVETVERGKESMASANIDQDAVTRVVDYERAFRALGKSGVYSSTIKEFEKAGGSDYKSLADELEDQFNELTKSKP